MSKQEEMQTIDVDTDNSEPEVSLSVNSLTDSLKVAIEGLKSGDAHYLVVLIGVVSVVLSFNGIETWGICGALAIVLSAFGIKLADGAPSETIQEEKMLKIGKILSAVGLGVGIACLVIGILVGIIGSLAAKANA